MTNIIPPAPCHTAMLRLADGTDVHVVVTSGPAAVRLMVDGDVADAASVGQALLDLLRIGEQAQRESAAAAARLDETVHDVEAARAASRTDW